MGDTLLGFSVASALLGSAVGAWFAGPLANRMGASGDAGRGCPVLHQRHRGGPALGIWSLTAFRVVGGLAIGVATVIAPAYIAEVVPAA